MLSNVLTFLRSPKFFQVAIIFVLALTVRLVYLYEIHDNPFFHNLTLDEKSYDQWAQKIAGGEWQGTQIFYQDPLYPYFLGVIYSTLGRDFIWVRVIQLSIGSITCVLIYLMGSLFFNRTTGIIAGSIAALYKPFFYFEAMFLKSFLATFLICLFIIVLVVARPRRSFLLWVSAGLILGLLALVRANTLVFAPGIVVWLFVTGWEVESTRHKLIASAGFMAGLFFVVFSVTARNYIVGKDFVLLTSQAGQNFLIGNNPRNLSGRYQPPIFIRPNPKYEQEDFRVRAEIVTGRNLKPSETSAYWFGEAFRFIRNEPGKWLKLMWLKFWLFWNWYEVPDNQNFYFFKRYSLLLNQPLPDFRLVAALALSGMVLCIPHWRKVLLLYLVVILYSATVIAFYIFGRYRLPVVPPLIVFAAFLLSAIPEMITKKKYIHGAAVSLLAILFWILLGTDVNSDSYYNDSANAYCRLGSVYQTEGKLKDARAAYERSVEILPYQWGAYLGLGEVYERRGEPDLALENYTQARMYNPGSPDICVRMGHIYYRKGQLDKSIELYRAALKLKPDWPKLHYWLARTYEAQGNPEQARFHLRKWGELKTLSMPE